MIRAIKLNERRIILRLLNRYFSAHKIIAFLFLSFNLCVCVSARPVQKGPYTVRVLAEGVYNIEDTNDSNPAGMVMGDDGQIVHMNNCSDMYLVVGVKKALLIDLSNAVKWDSTATESLRSIVYNRVGDRAFFITVTHKHGDHLGMLPAFAEDPKAGFWISEAEFRGMNIFPVERTTYFPEHASFDLGGSIVIDTMEVPGHTDHSTIFFLKDKNLVFTGDAIGSGSGVWLFNKESFYTYKKSIKELIRYLRNPDNNIDPERLVIYGGHGWQRGKLEKLTSQYVYDMETLIERMGLGIAEKEKMHAMIPFMDTNFKYGTAAISWNKEAAVEYADSIRSRFGSFTLISKHQDYGLTVTRLILDLGEGAVVTGKDLTEGIFEVRDIKISDEGIRTVTGLSVTDKEGHAVESGRYVTIDLDYGFDVDSENAYFYIVTLKTDLGRYRKGIKFIQQGDTVRK
jgi:glyoxylase-like metal-dependent hydrolase (beta-lactamase superfamily II)